MTEDGTSIASQRTGATRRWALLLLVCLVIVAVLGSLKYRQVQEAIALGNAFPERSEAVTAVIATPVDWQQSYKTIGEVRATRYIELRTEVGGKIAEIGFLGGDSVTAGQKLLVLDSTEERAQLQATRAQLKLAKLQLGRLGDLRKKNLASQNDYDSAEADKNILNANAAALMATIEKKTLTAPFDAQTGLHTLQVGQYLAANTTVTELTGGLGEVWIDFSLPQGKESLAIGDLVQISSRSVNGGQLQARVISANASLNTESRSRGFRALLVNPPEAIRPGAVVDVKAMTGSLQGVFRLPASAVRRNNFGAYVYVLKGSEPDALADYRASRRAITIGPSDGSDVLVTGGLEPGEMVAAIGAFKLLDGLLSHVVEREEDTGSGLPGKTGDEAVEGAGQ